MYKVFKSASEGCLRSLALRLRTTHPPPGDYIMYQGDEISHLYFIMRGTVEILRDDVIMAILGNDIINISYVTIVFTAVSRGFAFAPHILPITSYKEALV
jgi:signal-transduction protein with cAMP-binding, CBS, and nucleotidyltransferase domain